MAELKIQANPPKPTLRTSVRYLKGVGPEKQLILGRLGLSVLSDLFYFFPRRYEKRFPFKKIAELGFVDKECVAGTVVSCGLIRLRGKRNIFKVVVSDGPVGARRAVSLQALFYNQPFLARLFAPQKKVIFYGKAQLENAQAQMIHPEYEIFQDEFPKETAHSGRWTPVYPLTEDLSQKAIRQLLYRTTREFSFLAREPLSNEIRKRHALIELSKAFQGIHFPSDLENLRRAYERLVFDEFLALELLLEMKKAQHQLKNKDLTHADGQVELRQWIGTLPFDLTQGQKSAISAVEADMKSGSPMNRLIQGDVGSGKTAVAAGALFFTAMNGFQGALMAPTEVLAQQLYFQMRQLLESQGIVVGYLAQSIEAAEKEKILAGVASGGIQIVVGTHALISEKVRFRRLGLAIVDEQHKFGVFQRKALREKGFAGAHFLLMTATPIPRTLAMTLYGDMDVSVIAEKPALRQKVKTFWVGEEKREALYRWLDVLIEKGAQAFIICPLVAGDEEAISPKSRKNARDMAEKIRPRFPERSIGLLHGRMSTDEKKKVMREFREKKTDILVSTVVVEVGVDVPNARCMIIENAEQFGLAQLHQLRGRVGRGSEESYCVLFSEAQGLEAVQRLSAFESTDSGFEIAETDLRQRGSGEIFGQKQHGIPKLRIGDLCKDVKWLIRAKEEARRVIENDTRLTLPVNRPLKQMVQERFGNLQEASKL